MPFDRTINDEMREQEEAFIASVVAKDAPAAQNTPAVLPNDPPKAESATAEAPTPPTPAASAPAPAGDDVATDPPTGSAPASEEVEVEEEEVEVTDEAFAAAMQAERASLSLESVPEAARPLVQKKIKDLEAGFTRSMQRLSAERKEAAAARAEARFQQERPVDYITELLLSRPELMDQVNAKLSEFDVSPTAREAHAVIVERARERAREAEESALAAQAAQEQKAVEITRMTKAAARAAGVPYEMGVEANVAAHLKLHGDITEAEVRQIAADAAKVWKRHLREQERTRSQQYVEHKVKDRKTAGLQVRPATGTTPTPSPRPVPTTDDEFIQQFVASGR